VSAQFDSARHQAALATPTGYRRWMRFTFFRGGETIDLEPISGSLTQDTRRNGRWDGRLQFSGDDLLPQRPSDILTPFGTRLEVELGLELLDGSVSTVPYGTYEVSSAKTSVAADQRVVDVGLADVSGAVDRYRFETPFTVPSGTTLPDMINSVVVNRIGINPDVGADPTALGAARVFGLDTETGPWAEVLDVLNSFSRTAYYDRVGHIQMASTNVDPLSAYPLSSLASLSADFDTRPPNVVVARGEAQDGTVPVQATAMDTDPSSPTYAGAGPGTSPYGRVTLFYASPLILTVGQAQSAANTLLAQNVGAGATYTLTVPYDPTISAGDVIAVGGAILVVDAATLNVAAETSLQVREL
jgi:uncharacterized protein DUF5047